MVRSSARLQNKIINPPIKGEAPEETDSKQRKSRRKSKLKAQGNLELGTEGDISCVLNKEEDLGCCQVDIYTTVKKESVDTSKCTKTQFVEIVKQELNVKVEEGDPNDEFSGYEHLLDKITVGLNNSKSDGSIDEDDPDNRQSIDLDSEDEEDEDDAYLHNPLNTGKRDDKSMFSCFYCDFACKWKGEFSTHLKIHKDETVVLKCDLCNDVFTKVKALEIHRLTKHPSVFKDKSRKHVCKYCKRRYATKIKLKDHIRAMHIGETPYECIHCSKKFSRKGGLTQHMKFHEGLRPFECKVCHAKFRCKANKDLHMKAHFGIKEYKCDDCGKEFLRKDQLKKHLISVHENRFTYSCSICNKSFKGHVLSHLRIHMNEKLHKCKECGKSFVQSSQLNVHMRTHTGAKPFQCDVCSITFAHAISLKTHMYTHTGEKPVKCQLCPAAFTQVPHLKKHMRTIHKSNKPYVCAPCHEFFNVKVELVQHLSAKKCKPKMSSDM